MSAQCNSSAASGAGSGRAAKRTLGNGNCTERTQILQRCQISGEKSGSEGKEEVSRKELGGEEQGRKQGKKKESSVGDGLLSHAADRILPWALAGLTAGFEMGPGGPPPLISPTYSLIY